MVTEVAEQVAENFEFDLNDPNLFNFVPDINTEEVPQQTRPAPPPDGVHKVRFRLGNREGGPVYIKFTKDQNGQPVDGKVIALLSGRVLNRETGDEGAFLKDWYVTTQVFKGQTGSQLTGIYFLETGTPIPPSDPKRGATLNDIKVAIETLFAEREYVDLWVKTRWIQSIPQMVELVDSEDQPTGTFTYVLDDNGNKVYDEVKGEKKIKALKLQQGIQPERAHLWFDYVAQEERSVNAEVSSLEDGSKFEHN